MNLAIVGYGKMGKLIEQLAPEYGFTVRLKLDEFNNANFEGITREIMQAALSQAREGRMHILGIMRETLSAARPELSAYAPRMITIKINGMTVNECFDARPAAGKILLQTEGHEVYFRNFELRPLPAAVRGDP